LKVEPRLEVVASSKIFRVTLCNRTFLSSFIDDYALSFCAAVPCSVLFGFWSF
jgi:hypothetical protein